MSLTKSKPQKVGAAEKTICYSKAVTEILAAQQKLGKALEKMSEQMIRLQCQQQQQVQADNNSSEQINATALAESSNDSSDVEMVILQAPWKRGRGRLQDRGHDRAHSRGRSHGRDRDHSRGRSRGRDRAHSRGRSHGRDRAHSRGRSHGRSRSRSSSSSSSSDEEFSGHMFMHPHGPHGGFGRHHKHHKHGKHGKHGKHFMKALHGPWGHGRRLGRRVYY